MNRSRPPNLRLAIYVIIGVVLVSYAANHPGSKEQAKGDLPAARIICDDPETKKREFLQEFSASLGKTDNAALLYSDAGFKVDGLTPGETTAGFARMAEDIFSRGWEKQDEGLRPLLEKNRSAMEEFRKAAALDRCDFRAEHKSGFSGCDIGFFVSGQTLNAARLVLLDAKRKEYDRDLDAALQDYLLLLRFIGHLEAQKEGGILKVLLKRIVEHSLFAAIKGFIYLPDVGSARIRQLLDKLGVMNNSRNSPSAVFTEEIESNKKMFLSESSRKQRRREMGRKFEAQVSAEYTRLMDRLTVVLIQAVEKNSPELFDREVRNLLGILFVPHESRAAYMAKVWGRLAMTQYIPLINKFNILRIREDLFAAGVALRLYEVEKAKAADRLEQLVPDYLAALPKDPFNGFKPVSYVKTPEGWVLYSFGPDGKDDRGQVAFDANKYCKSKVCPGDIVF